MIAPVNNVVINNDVAPSHRLRRMDSMSSIEISKVSKVSNSGRSIPKISKYRDTTKYRYRTFTSIAILQYFWYRTSTTLYSYMPPMWGRGLYLFDVSHLPLYSYMPPMWGRGLYLFDVSHLPLYSYMPPMWGRGLYLFDVSHLPLYSYMPPLCGRGLRHTLRWSLSMTACHDVMILHSSLSLGFESTRWISSMALKTTIDTIHVLQSVGIYK